MAHSHTHDHSHGHDHSHSHGLGHSHAPADFNKAFKVGIGLNIAFVLIEAIFGVLSGSLALLADAGHNLSDVLGLALAWGGAVLAQRSPTKNYTYGLRRTTILAALLNAMLLLVAIGGIAWEAINRIGVDTQVESWTVIWVAGVGVVINTFTAYLFMAGRKSDINIKGAYLHMAADALVSVGVVVGGIIIMNTGWMFIDPLISIAIVVVIAIGTWGLLRDSVKLSLDAVPDNIDPEAVRNYLQGLPGVEEVHDLHIWAMSTTQTALTAHIVKPDPASDDALLQRICTELHDTYSIEHPTIQFERDGCAEGCDPVV